MAKWGYKPAQDTNWDSLDPLGPRIFSPLRHECISRNRSTFMMAVDIGPTTLTGADVLPPRRAVSSESTTCRARTCATRSSSSTRSTTRQCPRAEGEAVGLKSPALASSIPLSTLTISPTGSRPALRALAFSDDPDGRASSVLHMPKPLLVLRPALPVILESVVAPVAAYYFVLLIAGFRGALIGALVWSYFLIGRRLWRHERVSTLLMLGTALLTLRTVVSFITGSAFLYFIQPTVSAFLAAILLVLTALIGRPFTQRFAHDFCPFTPGIARPARASTASSRISFLWAVAMFLNGAVKLAGAVAHRVDPFLPAREARRDAVSHGRSHLSLDHLLCSGDATRRREGRFRGAGAAATPPTAEG